MTAAAAATRRGADIAIALATLVQVIWALHIVIVKWSLGAGWSPLAYMALRFAIGSVLFAVWVLWREGSLRVAPRHLAALALCSTIGILLNQIAFTRAAQATTAATIALMMAAAPACAAAFAVLARQERVGLRHWLGVGLAIVGVAMILESGGGPLDLSSIEGDLWALGAAASWALYGVILRPLVGIYSASRVSAWTLLAGAPMLVAVGWDDLHAQDWSGLGPSQWGAFAYSTVAALLVTNVIWFSAIQKVGAARITALMPLQPVAGVVLAVVLLGEEVAPLALAGGSLVIVAVLATTRREPRPDATATARP